jgi:creatinine amidohydrolase
MRWNEMTAGEFEKAVKTSQGVCILPTGVIEKHGQHLPIGIDYMKAWHYADMAAEKEKVVVFPPFYMGYISSATHCPGTFALPVPLLLQVFDATCAEIARNGFKKIIIANAHGGNQTILADLVRMQCDYKRDYMIYLCSLHFGKKTEETIQKVKEETGDFAGHGSSYETAVALYLFPELVKMNKILPPEAGKPLNRLKELKDYGIRTTMDWYSNYPGHIAGYGGRATRDHGERICTAILEDLSEIIRRVKVDRASMELYREFIKKSGKDK